MKVELSIDSKVQEDKVIIYCKEQTEKITELYNKILNDYSKFEVYIENEKYYIDYTNIESIYSESGKVIIRTIDNKTFISRKRIYELESSLPQNMFLRISNSEIVNFNNVERLDFKLSGTICIIFKTGNLSYSSRRYIKKIKEFLK